VGPWLATLETCELYADGQASAEDIAEASDDVWFGRNQLLGLACVTDEMPMPQAAARLLQVTLAQDAPAWSPHLTGLMREIWHPFQAPAVEPAWRSSNSGAAIQLAQGIYADRAFDRLPILADALEDGGCTNADILNHCRQPGEHVRGCWCVDLVLGRE
jgi:hypothetical protein